MWLNATILVLVTLQRLSELVISHRNTKRLIARGGYEAGAGHYPLIIAFHTVWLAGLWYLVSNHDIRWPWLVAYLVLQAIRGWCIAVLGDRWTTRIIVMPDEPLVESGPYRYLRHPNYFVVAAEIFILPMAFGLIWYGLIFAIMNAAIVYWRIKMEDEALRPGRP